LAFRGGQNRVRIIVIVIVTSDRASTVVISGVDKMLSGHLTGDITSAMRESDEHGNCNVNVRVNGSVPASGIATEHSALTHGRVTNAPPNGDATKMRVRDETVTALLSSRDKKLDSNAAFALGTTANIERMQRQPNRTSRPRIALRLTAARPRRLTARTSAIPRAPRRRGATTTDREGFSTRQVSSRPAFAIMITMNTHIRTILQRIPSQPGIYIYKDATGKILYVGKAKRLRSRVRQYFQAKRNLPPDKVSMIDRIADIDYTVVASELEALLLETTLIKRHKPPFNIRMTDDKNWQYIKIPSNEDFPNIYAVRTIANDGARYFGPYTSSFALKDTLRLLRRIFLFRDCKLDITQKALTAGTQRSFIKNNRPCLDYHINKCVAPCANKISKRDYNQIIDQVEAFLQGKHKHIIEMLEFQMKQAARRRQYERAGRFRDQIRHIKQITERQTMISTKLNSRDVVSYIVHGKRAYMNLFVIRSGKLIDKKNMVMHLRTTGDSITAAFMKQFYMKSADIPDEILVQELLGADDIALLETWLTKRRIALPHLRSRKQVRVHYPKIGEAKRIIDIGFQNAQEFMYQHTHATKIHHERTTLALAKLAQAIGLDKPPQRIECYDISNISGVNPVGSMVVFEQGEAKKSDYRKFAIKHVVGPNDFAMMREVVQRRISRLGGNAEARANSSSQDKSFVRKPDLIIIDGGKGQLRAVSSLFAEQNITIPVISLAKKQEEIFVPGRKASILLPRGSDELYLIQRIRDEAHRFAISYYRKRHEKSTTSSILESVPGIGDKTRKKLLREFGSLEAIRTAPDDALARILTARQLRSLREML
jgi:excinuclease ABC subunit C